MAATSQYWVAAARKGCKTDVRTNAVGEVGMEVVQLSINVPG
jgi:hypothetical protein